MWKRGVVQPLASKEIVDEYLRVLTYPRFGLSPEEIDFILYQEILPHFEIVRSKAGRVIIKEDPSDDKFIRCAEAGKATIVISGDKHLIDLGSYGQVKILTPSVFLEALNMPEGPNKST